MASVGVGLMVSGMILLLPSLLFFIFGVPNVGELVGLGGTEATVRSGLSALQVLQAVGVVIPLVLIGVGLYYHFQ